MLTPYQLYDLKLLNLLVSKSVHLKWESKQYLTYKVTKEMKLVEACDLYEQYQTHSK